MKKINQISTKQSNKNSYYRIANESVKTNLTPDLYNLVRSEEFKKWFGDWENDRENSSKVLDENGEPMIVYHGASDNFDKFDKKYRGASTNAKSAKLGFFFTNDKNDAITYSKRYAGGKLYKCFLNLRNPIIKDFNGESVNTDFELVKLIKSSDDGVIALNLKDGFVVNNQYIVKEENDIKIIK
jgi:hypothetical protein